VQAWLVRHKRFHLHFTPTSSSWLNQVLNGARDEDDGVIDHDGVLVA